MKYKAGILIQLVSGLLLLLGYLFFGWSFSHAALAYVFEIATLVLLGTFYFLFSSAKAHPGPILFGGAILVTIALIGSAVLADKIHEFPNGGHTLSSGLKIYIKDIFFDSWFIWLIILSASILSFRKSKGKDRSITFQQELFVKIFTIFGILLLSAVTLYTFDSINKLIILILIVFLRIVIETWVYKPLNKQNES